MSETEQQPISTHRTGLIPGLLSAAAVIGLLLVFAGVLVGPEFTAVSWRMITAGSLAVGIAIGGAMTLDHLMEDQDGEQ